MTNVHTIQRFNHFTIASEHATITIRALENEYLIDHHMLYVKPCNTQQPLIEGTQLSHENVYQIYEGFTIIDNNVQITFYRDHLVVQSETKQIMVNGIEANHKSIPFAEYPQYKRSPRIIKKVSHTIIKLESPQALKEEKKSGLIQLIIPPLIMLSITIAISILMGRGIFVIISIAGTIMTLVTSIVKYIEGKKTLAEQKRLRTSSYEEYLLKKRKEIYQAYQLEKEAYEYNSPTPEVIQDLIQQHSERIYERNHNDEDFLKVTLGISNSPADLKIEYRYPEIETQKDELDFEARNLVEEYRYIDKPVVVDLKRAHLGLVGEKQVIHNELKALILQVTFLQSYHDVEIIAIYEGKYESEFAWLKWYPHGKVHSVNCIGVINSERKRDQVLGSIHQILKDRKQKEEDSKKQSKFLPHYIFIIDEPKWIMDHSIMEYLEKEGSNIGFSIIYTTQIRANLPENIETIAVLKNSTDAILLIEEKQEKNRAFQLQNIEQIDFEWNARNLGVLEHMQGISAQIPTTLTFFQLYQISTPSELNIGSRWKNHDSSKSLEVPLGARAEQDYVYLNLHEKSHGPHGLVAGTTGSGKSEIIQSYILSLAVNFSPYEVAFLLIDYKGGGMASLFEKLPHLLGTITNLDGTQSMRAMASIKSELLRRQNLFNECGVNHINSYNHLFKQGKAKEPLPHLFIISDEFAELKKEQPEFMTELVSAARIGRSLGVHLILATQKPTGVVDDQIWSNSKFKLALKVQDESDSKEILKTPDAASITLPGRAYLQVGNNEIYELFQSAWSGASYSEENEGEVVDDRVFIVNELGQGELLNQDLNDQSETSNTLHTQLDAVVHYIQQHYQSYEHIAIKPPWLPPLEEMIVTQEKIINAQVGILDLNITLGVVDMPEQQSQEAYHIGLEKEGNIMLIAAAGYGKTCFLTMCALSLARKNHVQSLQFYVVDLGNSGLIPLNRLHHTADYIAFDDTEKLQKLIRIINQEIAYRKKLLAREMVQNFGVYNKTVEKPLRGIVILIDNYDVVKELGYEVEEFFQKLSRDGVGLGIYMIATATRMNAVKYATFNNFKNKVAGYLMDESERNMIIGKCKYGQSEIRGRVSVKYNKIPSIMQLYAPVSYQDEIDYNHKIEQAINELNNTYPNEKAQCIPMLPERFVSSDYGNYQRTSHQVLVGLERESVVLTGFHRENSPFVIVGDTARGKTNVLKVILEQITGDGKVYLLDSASLELYSYKLNSGITYLEQEEQIQRFLEALEVEIADRNNEIRSRLVANPSCNIKEITRELAPFYMVVDDWDYLVERTKQDGVRLSSLFNQSKEVGISFIATVHTSKLKGYDEVSKFIKNTTEGLLLSGQGSTSIFPITSNKEIPDFKDGLLFHNGAYQKVRLPKYDGVEKGEK